MEFQLNFNMDNDAFIITPETEIGLIFEKIIIDIQQNGKTQDAILDSNGNKIGQWEIED